MLLFRFLGLTLIDDNAREIKSLRVINLTWSVVSLAIFAYLAASPSTHIFTRNYSHMSDVIFIVNYVLLVAAHQVTLLHVQLATKKDILWLEKIRQVDERLSREHDVKINHEIIERWNLTKVLTILLATVACSAVNLHYDARTDGSIFLLSAHNYCLRTIINLRFVQNALRVDLFKRHIRGLQSAVRKALKRNHTQWRIVFVVDRFNRKHNPIKKIDDTDDILSFKRIHGVLYETTKLLEMCFGWSLLAVLVFTFIHLTSNLYWFFLAFLDLDESVHTLDCVLEIIPSIMAASSVIYSSFDAGRAAREGTNLVIQLYTNTSSEYNVMVKEFLMQVYHERIENSANDFFLVDFELLAAMINTILTFMVILVQFAVNEKGQQ